MNIKKLTIFYETANCLNMSKVAKKMYISQPAISQMISELEADIGYKVFDRIGNKLYLTYEGEILLNYTRRILNLYEEGMNAIRSSDKVGKLSIGASTTIGTYIMPEILKEFRKIDPYVNVSLIIDNKHHIEELLLNNKIDVAFIENISNSSEFFSQEIWKDELVFISANTHPWAQKDSIEINDLNNEIFIIQEKGSGTYEVFETFMKKYRLTYKNPIISNNIEAIVNYVKLNMGVACISYVSVAKHQLLQEVKILRLNNYKIERGLFMDVHKDKYLSPIMQYFMKFCKEFDVYDTIKLNKSVERDS